MKLKKLLLSLLTIALLITLVVPSSLVTATSTTQEVPNQTQLVEDTNSSDNTIESNSYELPTSFSETLESEVSFSDPSSSENAELRTFYIINVIHDYAYVSSRKEHKHTFNVDAPGVLINPSLDVVFKIQRADYENGYYSTVATLDVKDVSYIKDYEISIAGKTGHYRAFVELSPRSANASVGSPVMSSSKLINRTGRIWMTVHSDPTSGKTITKPPANYAKGYLHTRPSNLNTKYEEWYNKTFNANLSVSGLEVHHIKPLEFGGDNSMSNLIHLTKTMHQGITAWFAGY